MSYVHQIKTFSHAVGTVRFGADPATSVLDESCRYRGVDNLHVVDASFMPTSAGLNPSLTISANALRVGAEIGADEPRGRARRRPRRRAARGDMGHVQGRAVRGLHVAVPICGARSSRR